MPFLPKVNGKNNNRHNEGLESSRCMRVFLSAQNGELHATHNNHKRCEPDYYDEPKSIRSREQRHLNSPIKTFNTVSPSGKIMATVFWD